MNGSDTRYFFTVFTPTYNRAHLLPRVYSSLLQQTERSFEWIVVDDGSGDGTAELVKQLMQESPFPITYLYQTNSGKHVAINRGVEKAQGFLMVIVDSDDWLLPDSLENIRRAWMAIPEEVRSHFVGVAGLYADGKSGKIIGDPFPEEIIDSDAVSIRARYNIKGDKFGANRVDVYRQFPFPEQIGSFVTEGLIWNRIARHYKTHYINRVLAHTEYQLDGLSAKSVLLRVKNPLPARTYYLELVQFPYEQPNQLFLLRAYANLVRFSLHSHCSWQAQWREVPNKLLWLLALPIGVIAYWRDLWILRRTKYS